MVSNRINLWPCYFGAAEKEMEIEHAAQKEYLKLTTNGKQIIARQSDWLIMVLQPELIADDILEMVEGARK